MLDATEARSYDGLLFRDSAESTRGHQFNWKVAII